MYIGDDNMIYKIGMLCKHFKGKDLLEKNIYRIEQLGVNGEDINEFYITYTGEGNLKDASNLVIYSNIFQDHKLFCREYEDLSKELDDEQKELFNQSVRVEPLSEEEVEMVNSEEYINNKRQFIVKKYSFKISKSDMN